MEQGLPACFRKRATGLTMRYEAMTTSKQQAARHLWKEAEDSREPKLERPVRSCSAFSIDSSTR